MWAREIEIAGIPVFVFGDSLNNEVVGFRLDTLKASRGNVSRLLEVMEWAISADAEDFCMAQWGRDEIWWGYLRSQDNYEEILTRLIANPYAIESTKNYANGELARLAKKAAKKHHTQRRRSEFQQGRDRLALALALIERDGYKCAECSGYEDLTIDHVIPVSKGGSDDLDNLRFLCRSHNSKKGDR